MDVTAVVVVGARAEPVDALTEVGGVPMVVLAVRGLLDSGLVDRVHLHDLGGRPEALARACAGLPVSVGPVRGAPVAAVTDARQRHDAAEGDGVVTLRAEPETVVLLHDAARPLAPAALTVAVAEAVLGGHGMAVPVLPLSDTVKRVDSAGVVLSTPDRAGLRVLQTPVAARAELLTGEFADPVEHIRHHLADGGDVHTVPGDPAAFAVRSEWDLELAQLLAERTIAG
jgi:2-C-methyl-D-erythritol 4-phosphate cytidylyltransferase